MKKPTISTIINYCSNDYRFIGECIRCVRLFSNEIIVPICSHFFDGSPENETLLDLTFSQFPDVRFIRYPFEDVGSFGMLYKMRPENEDYRHFLHSVSRHIGGHFAKSEYLLLLDADEIMDTQIFSLLDYQNYDAMRLPQYFYFRKPIYRAVTQFGYSLICRKKSLKDEALLNPFEREGVFREIEGNKCVASHPCIHHYSWVRPKHELFKKVETWGHHQDKPWKALIEEEFSRPFLGKDVVFNLIYETVPALFNPLSNVHDNVMQINAREFKREMIQREFA